ncbi:MULTISPECIES: hypothetical protein [Streptomyces]|uniref:Uncharacterized protein n=1 Tax=Streptomyces sviceus (strain ATCC 29083 / DSM 924 / JCM 4929 / NBRC 13980 / NCIMB 11184 / NRRL 5439 / UC 5370) TaxID=463191 RepID=B5HSB3_STRX2|nr:MULTISPECIES: hypothetical protein [Streptomyces]EDY55718.1 conserved hypothetical protein [Streptomyces sviceus ATCC 29083]MYT10793.1 hypothetical protein [Streptomyces sp. SID5470]
MTTAPTPAGTAPNYSWWASEPRRLHRDREEIAAHFPGLAWSEEGAGSWEGTLPRWPFDRPEPAHLTSWIGEEGLRLRVEYSQAYPMVAPRLVPLDPLPKPYEWTQTRWHVNGDATLCLLREAALWTGRDSIVDLLLKAAGWRVEYALMKHNKIERMSDNGIVDDDRFDRLLTQPPAPPDNTEPSDQATAGQDGPAC